MGERLLPPPSYLEPNPDHFLNRDREVIAELRERIDKMQKLYRKAENYKLRTDFRNLEDEKVIFKQSRITRRLQQELDDKTQELINLNARLQQIEEQNKQQYLKELDELQDYINCNIYIELTKTHSQEIDNYKYKIQELTNQNNMLSDFKENKDKIDKELEQLREENRKKQSDAVSQQNRIEQYFRKEEENLKNKHNEEIRQLEVEAKARARAELSKEEQSLHENNIKLYSDINAQRSEVENMKRDRRRIRKIQVVDEKNQLRREVELAQHQMEECASKQSDMAKTIKLLKEKIKVMESTLTQVTSEASKEKEMLIFEFSQRLRERDEELQSNHYLDYRQQVRMRSKEIKQLRSLSQMILDQRSDVEQFFLEALEQIREEVRKRIQAEGKSRRLPNINQKGKVYTDKVELSDLDWEDRERVLRLLFAKMNMGVPPPNWRETQ